MYKHGWLEAKSTEVDIQCCYTRQEDARGTVSLFWASLKTKNFSFSWFGNPELMMQSQGKSPNSHIAPFPISHQKTWNMLHPSYCIYNMLVFQGVFHLFLLSFWVKKPNNAPKNCPNHQPKYCWWARCNSVCSTWPRCKVPTTSRPPKNTIENIYKKQSILYIYICLRIQHLEFLLWKKHTKSKSSKSKGLYYS